jgi:hypothetical protein
MKDIWLQLGPPRPAFNPPGSSFEDQLPLKQRLPLGTTMPYLAINQRNTKPQLPGSAQSIKTPLFPHHLLSSSNNDTPGRVGARNDTVRGSSGGAWRRVGSFRHSAEVPTAGQCRLRECQQRGVPTEGIAN